MKKMRRLVLIALLFVVFQGCRDKEATADLLQYFETEAPKVVDTVENVVSQIKGIKDAWNQFQNEDSSTEGIPAYSGKPNVKINENIPSFSEEEITTEAYEFYSELDVLNRPGMAIACVGPETLPTEERGSIGQIKPVGWHTVKYDCITDGMYLYNRCHLIGYQLCGTNFLADENDDTKAKNLITGTRYLNVEGMLPFENMIAVYVEKTGNHVIYRVTPIYTEYNLVADGVQMEAWSVEDNGEGICFNVFCYNVQPGIEINYATGESWEVE